MSIKTDLSNKPYNDDFSTDKKFYKILFQPGVSTQVRELNQLQSILQNQVEKFGDVIFRKGSIIDGCNFIFQDKYPYAILNNNTIDNVPTVPSLYIGMYAKNANNLTACIINAEDGYSSNSSIRKTIYLNYINSGDSNEDTQFSPGELLTVYHPGQKLYNVDINNGGTGFSNSDEVVFVSKIDVSEESGNFSNGDYLYQTSTGANAQIINIANGGNGFKTLTLKPKTSDLTNSSANSLLWTFDLFESVRNNGNTAAGTVKFIHGAGAKASMKTNASGKVTDIVMINYGKEYDEVPYITIKSSNNTTGINNLDLTAKNYYDQVRISSGGSAVGNGYAFGVTKGVIFQKGFFLEVSPQTIIVSNYSESPNNVSVAFDTIEEIITFNEDQSLLDNATGEPNENAPGANRLKLTPTLVVLNTDDVLERDDYLPLVQWNNGNPYKQSQYTIYSKLGDEMARRDYERSGNYVLDPFLVTTDCVSNSSNEGENFTVVVDPGVAYISGYRTETRNNFRIDVPKAYTSIVANNQKVSLNYGSYIRIKEVGGVFQFSTGDTIDLYSTAKEFLSNVSLAIAGNTTPQGSLIGTARIRSLVLENGIPGNADTTYRLYLFNIDMNAGANFKNVKSVYYDGSSYKGIADIVLELDSTTASNIAKVNGQLNDQLIFSTGIESIKSTSNTNYIYRTIDQTATTGNNGILIKSVASTPDEFFPYSGNLSTSQLKELYVVPVGNNLVQYTNLTGNVNANTTSANLVGSGTQFISEVEAGDYLYVYSNSITYDIKKVISVVNNTLLTVDSNCVISNTSCQFKRIFPKNIPVPFGLRSGLTANVNSNGNILTLNYGITFEGTTSVNTAIAVNIQRTNVSSTAKTANRNRFIKLRLANNSANTIGPWCVGIPDVFRLRKVYVGNSSVSTSDVNVVSEFYIDHNQTANYLDLSYLYLKPKSSLSLSSTDYLLVEFDHFTSAGAGYYDTVSYLGTSNAAQIAVIDSRPLSNLSSAACSWEIPEIYTYNGNYYNLNNTLDFRPYVSNTVASITNSASAPLNPDYILSFGNTASPSNDKKFPVPDTLFTSNIDQYQGRIDNVVMGPDGNIVVVKGTPSSDLSKRFEPNLPQNVLKLQRIDIPAYPNLAKNLSNNMIEILSTNIANEIASNKNMQLHTIMSKFTANNIAVNQPSTYTMEDIGALERRISDLEYYNRLNLLETKIANKVIPSSIDGTINRFKFGFFVDDFSTSIYTARNNPQYNADIEPANLQRYASSNTVPQLASNFCVPPKFRWSLKHFVPAFMPLHTSELCISQNICTEADAVCSLTTEAVDVNDGIGIAFHSAVSITKFGYSIWSPYSKYGHEAHTQKIKMANNTSGNITVYTTTYSSIPDLPEGDPAYRVYQDVGNTQIISSANAIAFTQEDWDFLNSNKYTRDFIKTSATFKTPFQDLVGPAALYGDESVLGSAKMIGYHDHTIGTDYTLVVEGAPEITGDDQYGSLAAHGAHAVTQVIVFYPADDNHKGVIITDTCANSASTKYIGTMNFIGNQLTSIGNSSDYVQINCNGLKPNTIHKFYVDGIEITNVMQDNKLIGSALTTNEAGSITFKFFPDESWKRKLDVFSLADSRVAYSNEYYGYWQEWFSIPEYNFIIKYSAFTLISPNSAATGKFELVSQNKVI